MSDAIVPAGDIFAVSAAGGEPRNLTPGMKASGWLAWLPSSHQLLFTSYIDGASGIATVDHDTGNIAQLWTGS
jgi:Tol biopolymer transport system component